MNNEIIISNIAPQDIKIEGGGSIIGLTDVYVNGVDVTVGSVAYVIVPTKLSELENNVGYITSETDPTVPTYIKQIRMSDITSWNNKQNLLVSGTNIKTINNNSILGSGNLDISTSYTAGTGIEITEENVINNTITSYNDLTDRPTIPTHTSDLINNSNFVNGNSLSQIAYTGDYEDIIDKPDLSEYITKYVDNLVNYYTKDFMYGLLPKVSDEDTSITLNDTYPSELKLSLNPSELEQETTTGKNLLQNNAVNQTINGVTFTKNEDGTINVNGTATSQTIYNINENVVLNGTYIITGCPTNGADTTYFLQIYGTGGTNDYGNGATTSNINATVRIVIRNGATLNNLVFKPMIRLSSVSDSSYEPYTGGIPAPNPDYPMTIHTISGNNTLKVIGSNWFDETQLTQATGWTYSNGYYNGTFANFNTKWGTDGFSINIDSSKQYTLSLNYYVSGGSALIRFIYTDGTYSGYTLGSTTPSNIKLTSTAGKTISKIIGTYASGGSNILYIKDIMLNIGTDSLPYESYQEQTAQLNLGDLEYSAIGNYKDEFYKATDSDTSLISGKWYLKKNIGKVVLDGSEFWGYSGATSILYTRSIIDYATSSNIPFSNYYTGADNVEGSGYMVNKPNNTIAFINISGGTTPRFYVKDTRYTDNINDFKTWLSNNNITLYYALATPTYTLLNDTLQEQLEYIYNQMLSYKDQTNISQVNDDLPFIISATTLKDISSL